MNMKNTNITSAAIFNFASFYIGLFFRNDIFHFNKNIRNERRVKCVLFAILKKVFIIFTTNIEIVDSVILKQV